MSEFREWPKTPRLFKPVIITEKIDGTNACVVVERITNNLVLNAATDGRLPNCGVVYIDDICYAVFAQSRKRLITPQDDNYGFARWVQEHAHELVKTLGEGYHYGEWWGKGIQRGYDMPGKMFSLFNVSRWADLSPDNPPAVPGLSVVPTLAELPLFDTGQIWDTFDDLRERGSEASPGFMNPEGIIIYHTASGQVFKMTDAREAYVNGFVTGK